MEDICIDGDVYFRRFRSSNIDYFQEFKKQMKEITGEDFYNNLENFNTSYIKYDNEFCICGHDCSGTYLIEHEPTKKKIAVGSVCIDKVWSGFINDLKVLEKNGRCKICQNVLVRGGHRKNYNYNFENFAIHVY